MHTLAELKGVAQALKDQEAALAAEVGLIHTSVDKMITDWDAIKANPSTSLTASDQAQFDADMQSIIDTTTDLGLQTASLQSEQKSVDFADSPTPDPVPVPPQPAPAPPPPLASVPHLAQEEEDPIVASPPAGTDVSVPTRQRGSVFD